jgi:ATP-dependent DNA ligase
MTAESIELLKNWRPDKMHFPAIMQEKIDGVPIRIRNIGGHIHAWTRQNERITSCDHIIEYVRPLLLAPGSSIIGELQVEPRLPFKTVSGLVRRKEACPKLILNVFDADLDASPGTPYLTRRSEAQNWLALAAAPSEAPPVRLIPGVTVHSETAADQAFALFMQIRPTAEGVVFHSLAKPFNPGKRCWGTQRRKAKPTIDLEVHSFEEAIDKFGKPKGMVGRINCRYTRKGKPETIIGIGPGKLSHAERTTLWRKHGNRPLAGSWICQVEYMTDPTYDALRQPTWQCWRPDKTEGDVHDE